MLPSTVLAVLNIIAELSACHAAPRSNRRQASFPLVHDGKRAVQAPGFVWGTDPMRGVNIGGWLVMEPWITPSMFSNKPNWVVDEWTYGAYMSSTNDSMSEIRYHWNTWFSYAELENIASVGLNTIRVQIGYWSVIPLEEGEPYLVGAYEFLKLAVKWASSLNLKVMIDLHGAPGSQNGFDNSGLRGTRQWFGNSSNIARTLTALQVLTSEFTQPSYGNSVLTIELVNEPYPYTPTEVSVLQQYYQSGYWSVKSASQQAQIVVALDEAFQGLQSWENFMTYPSYTDVAMDTHIYAMFDLSLLQMGYTANLVWTCSQQSYLEASNQVHWTIVGEFTPANTDCAYWLNGKGAGARFDNTLNGSAKLEFPGDCSQKSGSDPSKFSADYIDHLGRSFEAQTWVYEQASGWIMWTWHTEMALDWSMKDMITYGWIPTPITAKPHGQPCNYSTSSSTSKDTASAAESASSAGFQLCLAAMALALLAHSVNT